MSQRGVRTPRWRASEEQILRHLFEDGASLAATAEALNRSRESVNTKALRLGFSWRDREHGPRAVSERFWAKVAIGPWPCWLWTGGKDRKGYGGFGLGRLGVDRRRVPVHRFAWEACYGPIPDGLHVLHRCDVPACVRPDHLFLGTAADNTADMMAKGRGTGRKQGAVEEVW